MPAYYKKALFAKFIILTLLMSIIGAGKAYAWVGDGVSTLKGTQTTAPTSSTNPNQSTAYAVEWSTSEFDSAYYSHDPGGANPERLTVDETGDFLVSVTFPMSSALVRSQVEAEVYVNGTAYTGTIGGSSYIRNNGGHAEASDHVAALLTGLGTADYIEVFVRETGISGTVSIDGEISLYVEHISSSRTVFNGTATQTNAPSSPTNLNQLTAYELEWAEDRKDSGFTHSDVTNPEDIQLDGSGYYLVYVNVPIYDSSATDRQNPRIIVQLGGVIVNGGYGAQGYLRDQSTYNNDSSVHWSGVVVAGSDSQVLTVQTQQEAAAGTTTVPAGKEASIYIEKLSDTTPGMIFVRGNDLTTGTDWDVTPAGYVEWEFSDFKDTTYFTHSTLSQPQDVEVEIAGDYLLAYNDAMTSATARAANRITVEVNGTPVSGAETKTHYMRQTGGHQESSASLVYLLEDLSPNDVINIGTEREAANATTNDNEDSLLFLQYRGRSSSYTSQLHYRWRDDTVDLNGTGGWLAALDTVYDSASRNTTYRLRVESANVGGSAEGSGRTYELQYGVKSTTCAAIGSWIGVDDSGDVIDMVASANITPDGESTTSSILANGEGYTFVNGRGHDVTDTTASIGGLSSRNFTELEYSLEPTNSAPYGTTYCFRLYDTTAGATLDNYDNYAELTVDQPFIEQFHYRWRDDTTDLNTGGGWITDEDSDPSYEISVGDTYRLRMEIANTGSIAEGTGNTYEIEYGKLATTCAAVSSWTGVADAADDWDMVDTTYINPDGETVTPGLLANNETYTFFSGRGHDVTDITGTLGPISPSNYTELEFSFNATASSSPGATYCFRLVASDGDLENYNFYPTLTVEGGFKVQKIMGSITGTLSQTETIPDPITSLENAFLMFDFTGANSADNLPQEGTCTAYISSTSQVTVEKSSTSGTCQYAIYVVEALKNEFRVRGRGSITLGTTELSDTGPANNLGSIIDTGRVFIPGMARSDGNVNDEWRETYSTLELTDPTTVTATRGDNTGTDTTSISRYEVVEFLASGVSIQTGEADLTNLTTTDQTITLGTTVDTTRSFAYATFRHLDDGLAQTSVRMWLSASDTLSFDRNTSTANLDSYARWWVIEFPSGGVSVQRNTGSTSANDIIDISIPTPVEVSRSFPTFYGSNSGTGNAFPRGRYTSNLVDDSNVQYVCGYSGNTFAYAWQVVDTSGLIADQYNFVQNDFEFFETANSVTLTNNWPPGDGEDLLENEVLTQIPASNETLALGDQIR